MALFNKLFPNRRVTHSKHQDHVSEKLFDFNTEQVRVLLFRECDFRGRRLLFDSSAVEKIPMEKLDCSEKYAEVSSGYGYLYTKPHSDCTQLSEMVFGSVAMSFRGTYFKIHSLTSPTRLMFTQVFPSPYNAGRKRLSVSSRHSHQNLEHSIKLDDSGASSMVSMSEQLSDRSTASDTVLVCRRGLHSSPLDVPNSSSPMSNPSFIVDSGCTDPSFSSISTGPTSLSTWDSVFSYKVSSCGLLKRLLRSSSRSLANSGSSLIGSGSTEECYTRTHHRPSKLGLAIILEIQSEKEESLVQFFMEHVALLESMIWRARHSIETAYHRPHSFLSKMTEVAQAVSQWLLNLLSGPRLVTNLWQSLSNGCDNLSSINAFKSSVFSDNNNDISRTTSLSALELKHHENSDNSTNSSSSSRLTNSWNNSFSFANLDKSEFLFFNLNKFLNKTDNITTDNKRTSSGICDNSLTVERFLKEFCEILEAVDIKDTNFFMSTLLTAVLTHHLGWVSTCFPSTQADKDVLSNIKSPYNILWDQLTDLYGAVGHPVKTAQTIITGSNKNDIINKILNCLTYFIRCGNVDRTNVERDNIAKENKDAENICSQYHCIPKENYKKYEDHLREILTNEQTVSSIAGVSCGFKENVCEKISRLVNTKTELNSNLSNFNEDKENNVFEEKESSRIESKLVKVKSHLNLNLSNLADQKENIFEGKAIEPKSLKTKSYPNLGLSNLAKDKEIRDFKEKDPKLVKTSTHLNLNLLNFPEDHKENTIFEDKPSTFALANFCNLPAKIIEKGLEKVCSVIDLKKLETKIKNETQKGSCDSKIDCDTQNSDVIFVLGDDEKLVGLKKESTEEKTHQNLKLSASAKKLAKRPSTLCLQKLDYSFNREGNPNSEAKSTIDQIKIKSSLSSSHSLESLRISEERVVKKEIPEATCSNVDKKLIRSQSEPPEERVKTKSKTKFRYSAVKFNLQQYPQVVTNYMKSKNLELGTLPLGQKALKFGEFSTVPSNVKMDFSEYESDSEEVEALQTPSNATELEFTSDLFAESHLRKIEVASKVTRKISVGEKSKADSIRREMKIVNVPMPLTSENKSESSHPIPYTSSLMKGIVDDYIPDMVLQGTVHPENEWHKLKSNLALTAQHSLLDHPVDEAVAIVANTDTWEVQIMSSHTFVIDKGTKGIRVGMSQLVANMLESLLQMWKLQIPPKYCIMHIEQRLQELCIRSKAVAQLLLATEFCSMELLTSTLHLEVNDVPLLMAVASTHTPQVTQKYGLSFQ